MTEHSPLPWFVPIHLEGPTITDKSEGIIADIDLGLSPEVDQANAAYIVKACNAYPELVKALEQAVSMLNGAEVADPEDDPELAQSWKDSRQRIRDVLAKAKGDSNV